MLVVLAKFGTPEMVGEFALALAITSPAILFANLNLRTVQIMDARREYEFGEYVGLRLITLTLAVFAIAVVAALSRYPVEVVLVTAMVALAKVFDSLSDLVYGLLQQRERMDRMAISMVIQGVLQLATLAVTVYATRSIIAGAASMAVASGLVTAGYDVPSAVWVAGRSSALREQGDCVRGHWLVLRPQCSPRKLLALARLALPLGVVAGLSSLNANLPRYFIERQLGERQLGIFAGISSIMFAGGMIVSSLLQSASPRLARYYMEDVSAFKRLMAKLLGFGALNGTAGVAIALLFGSRLLAVLYRPEYARHPMVFTCLMGAAGLAYVATCLGVGIAATRRFELQPPVYAMMVAVTALGCTCLIPRHGLLGAAWAFGVGVAVWLLGFAAVLTHLIRVREQQSLASR